MDACWKQEIGPWGCFELPPCLDRRSHCKVKGEQDPVQVASRKDTHLLFIGAGEKRKGRNDFFLMVEDKRVTPKFA